MDKYTVKSAWPEGAQWEYYVENTENHHVAYPDYGYTTKENCERWISDPTFDEVAQFPEDYAWINR